MNALSLLLVFFVSRVLSTPDKDACTSLVASLGTSVVQSSGAEYEAGAHGAWNLFNTAFAPTCIVFPLNASHVQTAMTAIYTSGSDYAVQAGGHSAMTGWNNVQDGVLIDFSHMKKASYDASKDRIHLDPGVRWDEAVNTLQSQGVAPVGGRQGDIGTGLLLGGGLSFLSPAHGFAADTFAELDVVLVSGQLVTATGNNEYSDLFRALKGGANRFGIVTRYELYPVHTGTKDDKVWYGGTVTYSNSSLEAVVKATANYVRDVKDPKAVLLTSIFAATDGVPLGSLFMFYNGTELPASIFGGFLAIPSVEKSLGPQSYVDVAATIPLGNTHSGQYFGSSALVGNETLYLDAYTHWLNFTNTFKSEMSFSILAFTPVLDHQIQIGRDRGGNSINPTTDGYALLQIAQQFLPGVPTVSPELEQGTQLLLDQIPRSPGKPLYINESNEKQKVFETYGDFEALKVTYAKYDPTRFNVRHTKGPVGL